MIVKRNKYTDQNLDIDSMKTTFGRYWRKRNRMLQIGHRGMGSSYTKFVESAGDPFLNLNSETLAKERTLYFP